MNYRNSKIRSFDRSTNQTCIQASLEDISVVLPEFKPQQKLIPRGAGLSYGPLSFGSEILSLNVPPDNKMEIDRDRLTVSVGAGVALGDLYNYLASKGFYLKIQPGHPAISVGGCIACNVHGKSQYNDGLFSSQVVSLELYNPDFGTVSVDPVREKRLFELTVGGFGLTGIILSAVLKITHLQSFRTKVLFKQTCMDAIETLINEQGSSYSYTWNNFTIYDELQSAVVLGEEVGNLENHKAELLRFSRPSSAPLPFNFYTHSTNKMLHKYFAVLNRNKVNGVSMDLSKILFPLNGRELYWSFYGLNGFHEMQIIIPIKVVFDFIEETVNFIRTNEIVVPLSSCKIFRGVQKYLNFVDSGVCLSMNFARCQKNELFLEFIDKKVLHYRCIPSIVKDSRLPREIIFDVYSGAEDFVNDLKLLGANQHFTSEVMRRVIL